MHDLPPEILLSIFEACACSQKGSKDASHQPCIISHVCRQWRTIALTDPRLWTDVQIHGTSPIYRLYLQRSRPALVDLTIECTGQEQAVVAAFVQEQLTLPDCQRDMVRLRSLRLVAWADDELNQLVSPLKGLQFPHLASLHVEIDATQNDNPPMSSQWWAHRHSHAPILLAHTPKLSAIGLINKCTDCLGETKRLTKLELGSFPGPFDCTVLEKIVQASPCLDTLVLGELDFLWHGQRSSRDPVCVSQIKHLSIASSTFSKGGGLAPRCYCLVRNLVEGGLESLEMVGEHQEALCHLLPSITRRDKDRLPLELVLHQDHPSMLGLVRRLSGVPQVQVSYSPHKDSNMSQR